jgi:hypothetical protein
MSWDDSDDYSDGFWVSLGNSGARTDPAWTEHTIDGSFNGASSVYAVDIDGDGNLDVLATAETADDITWWENNLDGDTSPVWIEHTIDGSFDGARSAYAIDLDDDGDMDVLGAADQADDITWWENVGDTDDDGTIDWSEHTIDGDFLSAYSVHAADIDGDGDLDVLGAANGNNVAYDISWWENDGNESFTKRTIDSTFAKARCVYAQDVDLDGDIDVVGAAYGDNDINWWENVGDTDDDGTIDWSEHAIDTSFGDASSVYAIDVDNDGDVDILGAARSDDDITWWENSGTGGFTEHTIDGTFDHAISVYAIDVDNDGDIDVLGAARLDDDVTWWENVGDTDDDGTLDWSEHTIDGSFNGVESIFAADMDNDGDIDVLGAANLADDITWWENTATFSFDPTWVASDIATSASGAQSVFAADMDGDGDMDIISASDGDDTIAWYENDGTADPSWTASNIDTNADEAKSVFAADMDNDGDMDIISASMNDDTIAWYENDGESDPSWTASNIDTNAVSARSVFAADMDGDGDMDIVSASYSDSTIAWYENDGAADPSWAASDIATSASGAMSVFAADMDGDGDIDILSASKLDDTIAWYENNGAADPSWAASDIDTNADGAFSVFAADMDNDGDMDILSASDVDDTIAWYENDGAANPSWTASDIDTNADNAKSVFAADMDNDGDMDILSASDGDSTIAWYENDGAADPSWTASDIATSAYGATSVFAADMDGDGDMDIVSASQNDHTIAWYENNAGIPEFSNILMPIVSVLAIVGLNYRRRKINLDE